MTCHKPGGGWDYSVDSDHTMAYLRITNFTRTTGEELHHAIEEMRHQGVKEIHGVTSGDIAEVAQLNPDNDNEDERFRAGVQLGDDGDLSAEGGSRSSWP